MIKFSKPQEYILTTTQQISLFLAGVGSGKTHLLGFVSAFFLVNFPKVFGFIGANTYQQLTTSTLFRVREVWKQYFNWEEGTDYVVGTKPPKHFNTNNHNFDSYSSIISFRCGSVVFKGSLDNAKAHDGKEFGWACLDETKDSREEDVKDTILTRLRTPGMYVNTLGKIVKEAIDDLGNKNKAFNPLYIFTSPAKIKWINEWFGLEDFQDEIVRLIYSENEFFKKEFDDKCVSISSTYHNIENLPNGYIQRIESNHGKESAGRLIYGNPFVKSGGEFYSSFDRTKHVKKLEFDPDKPLHISFDQNVVPYITMTIYQIHKFGSVDTIHQLDEICLPNPKNKTSKLCLEFIRRWGSKCKSGLYYYGDPSGRRGDTRNEGHDYTIVRRVLRKYLNNSSERVPYKHPPVLKRKDFINDAFEGLHNFNIFIDPKCKKSIEDFEFLKEDINGKKKKEKATDKETGSVYEKYGHTSDSFDYFICEAYANKFQHYFS